MMNYNSTSNMSKCMNSVSGMVVKKGVALLREKLHFIVSKKNQLTGASFDKFYFNICIPSSDFNWMQQKVWALIILDQRYIIANCQDCVSQF